MIGPSAPNGPPVPMLIALEIGFSTASRGCTWLPLIRIRSIASGMPWPADLLGAEPGHQAHEKTAADRYHQCEHAERVADR